VAEADTDETNVPPTGEQPARITCSRGLSDWLLRHNVSLTFTSCQSGRLHLVGVDDSGGVSFHERFLAGAIGLWADPQRLVVSTLFQVWRFENGLASEHKGSGPDRHFVPRVAHTTGDLDIHDISVMGDGRSLFVNSLFSCLVSLSPDARLPRLLETALHFQARR